MLMAYDIKRMLTVAEARPGSKSSTTLLYTWCAACEKPDCPSAIMPQCYTQSTIISGKRLFLFVSLTYLVPSALMSRL